VGNGVAEGENGARSGIVVIVAATVEVGEATSEPESVEDGAGSIVGTEISALLAGAADSSSWHPVNKPAKKRHPENARTRKRSLFMSPD
jgi:hypothetical protein